MSTNSTIHTIASILIRAIEEGRDILTNESAFKSFMRDAGWNVTSLPTAYNSIASDIEDLINNLDNLSADPSIDDVVNLLLDFKDIFLDFKNITDVPSGIAGADEAIYKSEFASTLLDNLIIYYIGNKYKTFYQFLLLNDVINFQYIDGSTTRSSYVKKKLNFDKIFDLVKSPLGEFKNVIGWNNDFDFETLLDRAFSFLTCLEILTTVEYRSDNLLAEYSSSVFSDINNQNYIALKAHVLPIEVNGVVNYTTIELIEYVDTNNSNNGFVIQFEIPSGISLSTQLDDDFELKINATSVIGQIFGFLITPNGVTFKYPFQSGGVPSSGIKLDLKYYPDEPKLLLGKNGATRLDLKEAGIGFSAIYENNEIELILEADLSGLAFTINPGDSDGFIKKVFGNGEKKINLPIILSWSSKHGIRFKSSGAFEIAVSPNIKIGPIIISELLLALKAVENQPLKTQIGATISGKIGPISFIVENIGLELAFDKNEGNAGPFGIDIGFKPPNGVGLKVKASKLEGGGYLYIDRDKGRYAGGIELDIFGKLRVTAVGIITTKNPDGTPGFSLLIAVGVEFPGIPVGFGFTFNGVGVLAGVNRTMNPNALRAGVKGGAINSLMFPKNVIENIKTLITDMESYFPIEQKKYTFGVFFLLKWGVGVPLVSIKLGVIISFPQPVRLAIVGIIQIALPDPNVPVLKLNVAFVGIIDFENKYISFDASIYDSRLLFITLYGDMAVRLFWGERREMLVSVGGFHPAYNAPAYLMLPKMDRMTLSIFDEKNLRLIIETYFAVTSNTVQFGVKLDFLLKVWKLKVLGWFGFDVLFQFNPFKFLSHVYAGLAVMWDDKELLCISLDFNLNGPGPWHAVGKGEFTVLGMKQSANFDETWGDEPDTSAPEIEVTPKLLDALNKDENWQGSLPEGRKTYVKLAVSGTGTLIMDPLGEFTITQKVLPFTINIERFGGQKVKDVGIYSLDLVKVNGVAITSPTSTKENFASAQFKEMNDNDKIKAPSFEFLPNGVKIGYDYSELMFGDFITKDIEYDVVLIDGENRTDINVLNTTIDINSFTKGGLISANQISKKTNRDIASPIDKVNFNQESYILVSKDSLNTISTISIGSLGNAYTERDKIYTKSPELKGMYEIIPA